MKKIRVIKASGDKVPFEPEKLLHSLIKAGASKNTAEAILKNVKGQLYENIPTKELYKIAYQQLKLEQRPVAAKYKTKRAIMELGPTGFVFEKFMGVLFEAQGYFIQLNQVLAGRCVKHEIDIIATTDNTECLLNVNTTIRVALSAM